MLNLAGSSIFLGPFKNRIPGVLNRITCRFVLAEDFHRVKNQTRMAGVSQLGNRIRITVLHLEDDEFTEELQWFSIFDFSDCLLSSLGNTCLVVGIRVFLQMQRGRGACLNVLRRSGTCILYSVARPTKMPVSGKTAVRRYSISTTICVSSKAGAGVF